MLIDITVEGLRGYADSQTIKFAQPNGKLGSGLTIVLGPNNSGKSTLMEIFRLRSPYASPSFNMGMRNRKTDFVNIEFRFHSHTESIRSTRKSSSEIVVENANYEESPLYFVPSRRFFSHSFGRGSPLKRSEFINSFAANSFERSQNMTSYEGRLLQIERDQDEFNTVLKRIVPDIMDWSIDQYETNSYFVKFSSQEKTHSSGGVGDGIVSIFVICAALYDSVPGDVIAIDEPELSLHPQIQKRLMVLIEEYSKDRQIIISTHSPYLISKLAIQGGCNICRTWDRGGRIEVYQISLSHNPSGLSALVSWNANNPHVFGLDAKEVFFLEDRVLVCEGQEDVVLWDKIATEMPKYALYGWGAGGASNVKSVLSVLKDLGFKQVAAVLDNDRPQDVAELKKAFPEYMVAELPAADIRTKPAVPAREEKIGLLDRNYIVRPEMKGALTKLLDDLNAFMTD